MATNNEDWKNMDLSFGNIDALLGNENDERIHPLIPSQKNMRMCVIGGSSTGKTSFLVQFITKFLKVEKLYVCARHLEQQKLIWLKEFYTEVENNINNKLRRQKKQATFKIIEAWTNDLNEFPTVDELDKTKKNVVIFDDMVMEPDRLNKIPSYYVRGRHHGAGAIFFLSQSFFGISRKIRLNTNYYAVFNLPSLTEASRIHREVASDLEKKEFLDLFKIAVSEPYSFFFIACDEKKKMLKYRQNLDTLLIEDRK
jgi:hypothetical protein